MFRSSADAVEREKKTAATSDDAMRRDVGSDRATKKTQDPLLLFLFSVIFPDARRCGLEQARGSGRVNSKQGDDGGGGRWQGEEQDESEDSASIEICQGALLRPTLVRISSDVFRPTRHQPSSEGSSKLRCFARQGGVFSPDGRLTWASGPS